MVRIRINTRSRTIVKPYMINSQFLQNWEGQKYLIGLPKYVYVCEIYAEEIFVSFPGD